jgi:hypothetical protein
MKLSEAISLGAMLSPQAIGDFIDAHGGHCAWAAALDAAGHASTTIYKYDEWKWARRTINCPGCKLAAPVAYVIVHLNDAHRWSRSRTAEWVSTVEPTEETSFEGEEFSSAGS